MCYMGETGVLRRPPFVKEGISFPADPEDHFRWPDDHAAVSGDHIAGLNGHLGAGIIPGRQNR